MAATLEARLLGDFTLKQDGAVLDSLDTSRLRSLLAYLLLFHKVPQQRQRIASLFWPDTSESQARTNLRNLLHRLRQVWAEADTFLYVDNRAIGWQEGVNLHVDVAEFDNLLVKAGESPDENRELQFLQAALPVYKGELFPECYQDWLLAERARLQDAFFQALERCVSILEKYHRVSEAIPYCQQLIQGDPLRESAYRQLMHLHVLDGNRASALRTYYQCVTVLRRELDVAPGQLTQDAYRRLLGLDERAAVIPLAGEPAEDRLVGRRLEWEILTQTWLQISSAQRPPGLILISGEAGIGKTTLANTFRAWTDKQGSSTARAACYASEMHLSLAPVATWLRAFELTALEPRWRQEVSRLLPELWTAGYHNTLDEIPAEARSGTDSEPWQKQRFYEAMTHAVLAQKQPVCLFLEDMQWCDAETLAWLNYLLRYDLHARLIVIATIRSAEIFTEHPLNQTLSMWREQSRILEIELQPLDKSASAELAGKILGFDLSQEEAAVIFQHSEGNPLFIVETLRSVLEQSTAGRQERLERLVALNQASGMVLPPKIQTVLRGRLQQLSAEAQNLLGVAAVIGRSFHTDILRLAGEVSEDEMVRVIDELWRRRIIRDREADAYDFSHEKIRQLVYSTLSPARRRWLHGRVAQVLEDRGKQMSKNLAGQLAFHFEAAGQAHKALTYHELAARDAQRVYAYQEAIFHLQAAIALLDRTDPTAQQIASLYEQLGDAWTLTGSHPEARRCHQVAAETAHESEAQVRRLDLKIARTWLAEYELDQAWADFESLLTRLGDPAGFSGVDWSVWLDARLGQLDVLYFKADIPEMSSLVNEIRAAVEQHGTLPQRSAYFHMRVQLESRRSRFRHSAEAVSDSQQALDLARQSGDQSMIQRSQFAHGFVLLWAGEIQSAIDLLQKTADASQASGNIPVLDRCLAYLSIARRMTGDLNAVEELLAPCLAAADREGNILYLAVARANQAWLAYRSGALDQVAEHAQFALQLWHKLVFPFHWLACWPYLAVCLQKGDRVTALDLAARMLAPEQQQLPAEIDTLLKSAQREQKRQPGASMEHLHQAVRLAKGCGYL